MKVSDKSVFPPDYCLPWDVPKKRAKGVLGRRSHRTSDESRLCFRRLECYQCSTIRAPDVKRVTAGPEGPSSVLKVSGIDPHTT